MSQYTEIYVYEITADRVDEFLAIKDRLITETLSLPGLIQSATFRSGQHENLFIDRMKWENADAAKRGNALFMSLEIAQQFLAMMAAPPSVGGEFTLVAGS